MAKLSTAPILIPMELDQFWEKMRLIIREEIQQIGKEGPTFKKTLSQSHGLTYKPLFKINEMCHLLQVSRTTIYEWIKRDFLKPYKINSRVYFLWSDVEKLLISKNKG